MRVFGLPRRGISKRKLEKEPCVCGQPGAAAENYHSIMVLKHRLRSRISDNPVIMTLQVFLCSYRAGSPTLGCNFLVDRMGLSMVIK